MSLPVPNLDDRKFQDIVDEAKRLIPTYCPEWMNHNLRPRHRPRRAVRVDDGDDVVRLNQAPDVFFTHMLNLLGFERFWRRGARMTFCSSADRCARRRLRVHRSRPPATSVCRAPSPRSTTCRSDNPPSPRPPRRAAPTLCRRLEPLRLEPERHISLRSPLQPGERYPASLTHGLQRDPPRLHRQCRRHRRHPDRPPLRCKRSGRARADPGDGLRRHDRRLNRNGTSCSRAAGPRGLDTCASAFWLGASVMPELAN